MFHTYIIAIVGNMTFHIQTRNGQLTDQFGRAWSDFDNGAMRAGNATVTADNIVSAASHSA